MRTFPIAGPVDPKRDYCIPPLERVDTQEILGLMERQQYFVLHAPRQTGKTSTLLALRDLLNGGADHRCVYASLEGMRAETDAREGMRSVLSRIAQASSATLGDNTPRRIWRQALEEGGLHDALAAVLSTWAAADPKPLVLLLDEVDSLPDALLISILGQIRSRYYARPQGFPQSLVLCGVRDIRDYRIHTGSDGGDGPLITPFNIKAESLRLGDFTEGQVSALLAQHTDDTGQAFTQAAVDTLWSQTRGQPWLVNALAHQACFRDPAGGDRAKAIGRDAILAAREGLILRRETHIDQLADRLRDDRVRRVVEPMFTGEPASYDDRDMDYVRDLGLVAQDYPVRIANRIYAEVIPRQLTATAQDQLPGEAAWYVRADGSLDMGGLLAAFQRWYRESSEHWVKQLAYREAGPQLLLQAFLHRIVNGGGRVDREYALGRRRTDLLVEWPRRSKGPDRWRDADRHVIELKVRRGSLETAVARGVEQTADYMDRCGAGDGHLVIFDRDESRGWDERVFRREVSRGDRTVVVWGM